MYSDMFTQNTSIMNEDKQQQDDLGQPGEIRQYDRTDGPDTVRGDDLNPNMETDVTPIYLTGDITLQTAEESDHDRSVDVTQNTTLAPSNDDINQPIPPRMSGDSNQGTGHSSEMDDENE